MTETADEPVMPENEQSYLENGFNNIVSFLDKFSLGTFLQVNNPGISRWAIVEIYTISKSLVLFIILATTFYKLSFIWIVPVYFLWETINYNCLHIFQAEKFKRKKSVGRNIILGFFNYLEIIFGFAIFYGHSDTIAPTASIIKPPLNFFDYIYFSTVTGTTVGYGDLIATGTLGHILVTTQIFIFIFFLAIFATYNLSLFINK
jgi:ion channel